MIKAKEFLLKNIRNYVKLGITNNLGKVEEFDDKLVCYVDDRYKEKNCFKASENTKYFFHCGVLEKNINLAKKCNLNKKIIYIIKDKCFDYEVNVYGYDNCEIIFDNCKFNYGLCTQFYDKCIIKNSEINQFGHTSLKANEIIIDKCKILNNNYFTNNLTIIAKKMQINNSSVGFLSKRLILSIEVLDDLILNNSCLLANKIELHSKRIVSNKLSNINAIDNIKINSNDYQNLNVNCKEININSATISNYDRTICLNKEKNTLNLKRIELLNLLQKIKEKSEDKIAEEIHNYELKLKNTKIDKILTK